MLTRSQPKPSEVLDALQNQAPPVDLAQFVSALRGSGWTNERIHKNELPAGSDDAEMFLTFWRTANEIAHILRSLELDPILIKCVRLYLNYWDANVDVLIPRGSRQAVVDALLRTHWLMPSWSSRCEQRIIELAKFKLPSRREDLVQAHLYEQLSWRYQSDIGLIRDKDGRARDDHLVRMDLSEVLGKEAASVFHPNPATDLALLGAHVAFENYRMTLGEAINLHLRVTYHPEAVTQAFEIARQFGSERALRMVLGHTAAIVEHVDVLKPEDFPYRLPRTELMACFRERRSYLSREGRTVRANVEFLGSSATYLGLRVVRRVRRLRRGHEDFRWKDVKRS